MPLNLLETPFHSLDVFYFPYGEQKSSSIAAASIVAKVTRDLLMERMHKAVPGYLLEQHKGYSTPAHKKAVFSRGSSIIHRTSFLKNLTVPTDNELEQQQTILPSEYDGYATIR
jgi:ribonuclease HII